MAASPSSPPPILNSIAVNNTPTTSSIPAKRPLETASTTSTTTTTSSSSSSTSSASSVAANSNTASATNAAATTTTPAAAAAAATPQTKKVLERNQACLSCRSRKRKCDGGKPSCSACDRLERKCVYSTGGLSTVTKIHSSSSSFHASKTNGTTPGSNANRWPVPPAVNTNVEEAHPLVIHGPSPRTAQPPSPPPLLTAPNSSQSNFTAINHGSSSPPATRPSPSPSVQPATNGNQRPSHEPPAKRPRSTEAPISSANLFTARFLQASPFSTGECDMAWPEPALSESDISDVDLPAPALLAELVDIFFEQIHPFLPCLYRSAITSDIAANGPLSRPNPLSYILASLAAHISPDPSITSQSAPWAAAAKRGFDENIKRGSFDLLNVQAAVYICLYCLVTAEMAELWVFLAKAYRMCTPLGLHEIDSPRRSWRAGVGPLARSEQELEERRRAVWAVFVLDRLISWAPGWPAVVDERSFCVNFPVDEAVFQSGEIEKMSHIVIEPFAHQLSDLITPTASSAPQRSPYHYIRKLCVLLGHIIAHTHSPHPATRTAFDTLETTLARFRLSLPRQYRSIANLPASELTHVAQLNFLLHVCTILLHEPGSDPVQAAVGNIMAGLKMLVNCATEESGALANPFLFGVLFVAGRMLALGCREGRSGRGEVDLVLEVLERGREWWPGLAGRYRDVVGAEAGR